MTAPRTLRHVWFLGRPSFPRELQSSINMRVLDVLVHDRLLLVTSGSVRCTKPMTDLERVLRSDMELEVLSTDSALFFDDMFLCWSLWTAECQTRLSVAWKWKMRMDAQHGRDEP